MKPFESAQLKFAACKTKADVALWQGREKDGKPRPSNVSVRLRKEGVKEGGETLYLSDRDALLLASILQDYALKVFRIDSERRLEAWKAKQGVELKDALA